MSKIENTSDSQGPVIDHDGSPAYQLKDVQKGEQQTSFLAEAHFHSLHGAAAGAAADEARQKHHGAADDVTDDDRRQTLGHTQRRKGGAGEDLRQRNTCAEPDQSVLEGGCLFHTCAPPSVPKRSAISQKDAS